MRSAFSFCTDAKLIIHLMWRNFLVGIQASEWKGFGKYLILYKKNSYLRLPKSRNNIHNHSIFSKDTLNWSKVSVRHLQYDVKKWFWINVILNILIIKVSWKMSITILRSTTVFNGSQWRKARHCTFRKGLKSVCAE